MATKKSMDVQDPYFIDYPGRVAQVQKAMAKAKVDVYLGSRLRTASWLTDAFCPWRTYVVVPKKGLPTVFTFVIDAARVADDSWLDEDHVLGYAPMGGMDQISLVADFIREELGVKKGRIGVENGLSNYLPEGVLTHFEYEQLTAALTGAELVDAHDVIDRLSLIKDAGTINRFREASRIVDVGHRAVRKALVNGGYKGKTETEIGGIAATRCARREASGSGPSRAETRSRAATARDLPAGRARPPPGGRYARASPSWWTSMRCSASARGTIRTTTSSAGRPNGRGGTRRTSSTS